MSPSKYPLRQKQSVAGELKLSSTAAKNSLSRPTTAISRVLDKFTAVSGISLSLASSNIDRAAKSAKQLPIMAYSLQAKISKVIKLEQKSKRIKLELVEDFRSWASTIPNPDCEAMISEFATLFLTQTDTTTSICEKLDILKLNLTDVHEREKKQRDLYNNKTKLLRLLKESEVKFGPGASGSTLIKEKLEENVCNLEVVELQYIRSINKNLKDSLIEYLICLQTVAAILQEATQEYYGTLITLEQNSNLTGGTSNISQQRKFSSPAIGIKSRKDYIYPASGGISSIRPSELNDLRRPTSSIQQQNHQDEQGSPGRRDSSVNLSISNSCAQCQKLDKYTRLLTTCTHLQTNNNEQLPPSKQNQPSRMPDYIPTDQWN